MNAWNRHSSQTVHPEAILGLRIFPFLFNIELFVTSLWTRWPFSRLKSYLWEVSTEDISLSETPQSLTVIKLRRNSRCRLKLISYQALCRIKPISPIKIPVKRLTCFKNASVSEVRRIADVCTMSKEDRRFGRKSLLNTDFSNLLIKGYQYSAEWINSQA